MVFLLRGSLFKNLCYGLYLVANSHISKFGSILKATDSFIEECIFRDLGWLLSLILITRAQYAGGLCVCVRQYVYNYNIHYILLCVCVVKKHACSPMKTFSVLASLARAANPWLSKAMCPCKNTLRYCGCVTQPPIHIGVLSQSQFIYMD